MNTLLDEMDTHALLCRRIRIATMSFKMDWIQRNAHFHRLRILLDKIFTNRKLAAGVLLLLLLLFYLGPYWFITRRRSGDSLTRTCLLNHLKKTFSLDQMVLDSFTDFPDGKPSDKRPYVPFVGNGFFGVLYSARENSMYVRRGDTIAFRVPFEPVVEISPKFAYSHESTAVSLDTLQGSVIRVTAYDIMGECAFISSTIFAHRKRPNVFVQEVKVDNPTLSTLHASLGQKMPSTDVFKEIRNDAAFSIRQARLNSPDANTYYDVAVGVNKVSQDLNTRPSSQQSVKLITTVIVSDELTASAPPSGQKFVDDILKENKDALSESRLTLEHTSAWNELWNHGFSISHSKAPNALNGGLINATFYYLMSHSKSFVKQRGLSESRVNEAKQLLYQTGECFNFHNTLLYPSKLWSDLSTVSDVLDTVYRWKLTLDKRGCTSLVKSGVEGVIQATILSLGGFKFTQHHLEFDVDPQELHRNYFFRGILYDPESLLNVWVEVNADNKPVLYVSVNSTAKNKKFFACDAGCLDEPQELSGNRVALPVKLTNPLTPILYITDDQKHIQELKHAIHVKEVVEAPPHEHHVIAMHKHGHRLGGLPTIFWVALVFLLVTFHLFLFKLIYNEYFRNEKVAYAPINRMRYTMWRQS